jgi:hypothetical protein
VQRSCCDGVISRGISLYLPSFSTYQISLASAARSPTPIRVIQKGANASRWFALRSSQIVASATSYLGFAPWGVVDLIACHPDCIRPQVSIDAHFPSAARVDQHRPCQILQLFYSPFSNPIFVVRVHPSKRQSLPHLYATINPLVGPKDSIVHMVSSNGRAVAIGIRFSLLTFILPLRFSVGACNPTWLPDCRILLHNYISSW